MAETTAPPPPPAARKPAAKQPAVQKPAAKQPTVQKPAAKQPAVQKPAAKQPGAQQPVAPAAATAPTGSPLDTSPYGAQPVNPAYGSLPTAPPTTLSVLALVFGIMGLILSFFLVGLLPAIGAVILGHLALSREPHARGLAIGGLVTGYVGIGVSVLFGLAILLPALLLFLAISGLGVVGFMG